MPLTPEDVKNKLFTTVRLREGYDQVEVDEFLDEVEVELKRLHDENDELRRKLAASARGESVVAPEPVAEPVAAAEPAEAAESAESVKANESAEAPATVAPAPAAETAAAAMAPQIVIRSADEVSQGATRLLAMAQDTADRTVAEARADAERLVTEARANADSLTAEAKSKADELDRDTRARSSALDTELAEQRQRVLSKLEEERRRLADEVEGLKAFEREYRGRLTSFLEGQLRQLSGSGSDDTPLAPPNGPRTDFPRTTPAEAPAAGVPDESATEGEPRTSALERLLAEEEDGEDS